MKLLPILTAIWEYDVPASARAVGWAVVVNNIEALTSIFPIFPAVNRYSPPGNDVFECIYIVVIGSVHTCIDRMDDSRLDDVGWCFCKTCFVGIGEIGSYGWRHTGLVWRFDRCCLGILEGN